MRLGSSVVERSPEEAGVVSSILTRGTTVEKNLMKRLASEVAILTRGIIILLVMDFISHALWPVAIFQNARWKWKAALFGILPDVGTFAPLIYLFSQDGLRQVKWIIPFTNRIGIPYLTLTIPDGWMAPYYLLHSMVVWIVVVTVVFFFRKKMYWPLLGWGLHIAFDMFLHSGRYATQILYPLSDWAIDSEVGWQDPWVLAVNWISLLVLLGILFFRWQRDRLDARNEPRIG